jgi:signal transduction histidine kinase
VVVDAIGARVNLKRYPVQNQAQTQDIQVARLEMMLEVSRTLNSTLDLDVLLQEIINIAIELTETEAASVLLLDERKELSQFQVVTGQKQRPLALSVLSLEGSVAGWIIKSGEPLVIHNIQEDERRFSEIEQRPSFEPRMILGVPLVAQQKMIGVIEVFNKSPDLTFTGGDIQTLNTLATQAAIAIANARLFKHSDQLVNVFHEIRSPMTSIIGFSRIMLASPEMDRQDFQTGLESINREATRLSQIVNDFLDLAKIETGRLSMLKELVNLEVLVQEVIDLFYPQSFEKEITLSMSVDAPLPHIPADGDRLKQVIINLVDNAIKYNHHRGGEVVVALSGNAVRGQVSVRDTGKGIAPGDLELVFDKFYRIRDDEEMVRGAGLGLALAKRIIEVHGGDIWLESEVGVGSTFTFSLPIQG